ncbi:hypothetical protein TNCV_4670651 [Trichonephila clavipes]|nr:hypothetical protein TNCV_4670651 [Trichonephila clavipes]
MHHLARERIGVASDKMKTRYNARATGHDFHEGVVKESEASQRTLPEVADQLGSYVIEDVVDLARPINSEVDNVFFRELLDSHNKELAIDELMEMYEQSKTLKDLSL